MSQVQALASHWVLLFFLGLLNKYMLVWSMDYASIGSASTKNGFTHRTWSEWTEWSACSRTCGGGIKMKTRVCKISSIYSVTSTSNKCIGETVEYELCSVHNCSPYDKEFLEYQCSLRDGQVIRGKKIEAWIPYRYGKNPCELQCWSKDRSLVYSFGKAIDGTKCATGDPTQPALCINGRCTPVDCAGQIGSDNKLDRCGVCRGNNSTCIHYKDVFGGRPRIKTSYGESKGHHYDYEKITAIPAGVTEIFIKESSETNFLALMDHKGNYVINGNWKIQAPGRVLVHGSEFVYSRSWDGRESLSAQGPTRYDVYLYVLGSGDIPTINFEYWISTTNPLKVVQPFPVLNQIKHTGAENDDSKLLQPENNHIHDSRPTKKPYIPVTQFQGYKSYYHRNEILKSVPSWSIKRHKTHKTNLNRYVHAQNDISSSTVKNRVELNTAATPNYKHVPFRYAERNKVEKNYNQSQKHKKTLVNSKVLNYQSSDKVRPLTQYHNVSMRKTEHFHPVTAKSLHNQRTFDLKLRHEINTTLPVRRTIFEVHETEDEYGRFTTVENLIKNTPNYHRDSMITLQPNVLTKNSVFSSKHKNARRRQKSTRNYYIDGEETKHNKKRRRSDNENCYPCPKPKQLKKNFCSSEFVLRATVLSIEEQDNSYRYELQVSQSYKNRVPISPREYIWTASHCQCPKLRIGKEYVLMGYSGTTNNRRESKLLVDGNSFVRKYSLKRVRTVQRMVRDQHKICRKFQ